MIKTLTIAASAAMLSTIMMTPANAGAKQPTEESTVNLAPGQGIDIVERRGHHGHRFHFRSFGHGYHHSPCYWGWRHGKKFWVCY